MKIPLCICELNILSSSHSAEEEKLKLQNAVGEVKMQIVELEMQIQETTKLFRISKEKITATCNNVRTTLKNSFVF